MSEPQQVRKVSRRELLDIRERSWRPRADAASLAAETLDEIPVARREQALAALGWVCEQVGPGPECERYLRRWPAVHVLATAGVAAEHYEKGTFWPKLIDVINISPDPGFQRVWGEAFLDNLQTLKMPTFDSDEDAGSRYVGRILLHSGMPTYCLDDFFRILSWKRSRTPGLTPEDFVSWAAAKAASSGFSSLDMPVQRFLRYADEFAVDVVDRSFDLLDAVSAGASAEDVLLPERFWAVARKLHVQNKIDLVADRGSVDGQSVVLRPRLVLDPYGQGLLLRLPPVGDAPDGRAVWVVTLDDEIQRVATESLWPGSTEPAPQTDVAVSRPVRAASVALADREHLQFPMFVVDDNDPLLVFGDDCEVIAAGLPLPAEKVWMLFPGDPDSLRVSGSINVVAECALPPRWSGYCLLQVDLSEATAISVGNSRRTVRLFQAARIETAAPVQGVRTTSGLPVLAALPRVVLPDNMLNADWDITVQDSAGAVISRERITGSGDVETIWKGVPRPLVGTFSIRVRGPWGRGATRSFTLVEGLSLSFTPAWRRFVAIGLQPCVVKVRASDGIRLPRDQIEFSERDREQRLRISTPSESRTLIVSPPHMTVAYQASDSAISPSVRPLPMYREDVRDCPGELILDVGAAAEPLLHVMVNNRIVQTVASKGGRAGVYRFNLAEIVDTLRGQAQVALTLSPDGELVIATVRPRSLFSSIYLEGGELRLVDCVDVDGLTAYVFPTRAPWRDPTSIPVIDGRAALPDSLVDAGPLRVVARIDDPWVPLPAPEWPQAGTSTLIEADGWVDQGDPEEIAVSAFLAGQAELPEGIEDFARLWTARSLLSGLWLGPRNSLVAKEIDARIYASPAPALLALSGSEIPANAVPALMIRSGLAWANLADAHESSAPPWTLRGALPAALLSAADSQWSEEEIEAAIGICGDAVGGILDGHDPYPTAGRLDESAELLDREPAVREQLIRAAGLVPQGLLSADSRVLAAMEFVGQRRDTRIEWLMKHARSVLNEAERLVRIIGDPATQTVFDARCHHSATGGWRVVPAISMALALAARHASRGHEAALSWVIREKRPWEALAEVAPQLVTIDMIIAELVVGRRVDEEVGISQ
ncbi:hypothetical protein MMAN_09640 [Mycobacterium mantenii]|uniref:Uncharacterized protein n=1 Tax=Mycobacterium mantenii TaxID=560555 RepID=A0A1X0G0E2_MYCNT|nr:hypothetical protein [Mycobacterium mantenii]MCV7244742.1 hypothetical protein [Mycobacterium mantenii]ORB07513.1 hypothetical protein BST30_06065 [Mycobacterium mantenii]BBY36830.1 hypothetical protein MMAN_09640 [Mycobacterium mantenii]